MPTPWLTVGDEDLTVAKAVALTALLATCLATLPWLGRPWPGRPSWLATVRRQPRDLLLTRPTFTDGFRRVTAGPTFTETYFYRTYFYRDLLLPRDPVPVRPDLLSTRPTFTEPTFIELSVIYKYWKLQAGCPTSDGSRGTYF